MDAKPQVIKVSSKRQITIPAKLYQALGFGEHAWCVVVGNGLYLCPADDTAQEPSLDVEAIEREVGAPMREAVYKAERASDGDSDQDTEAVRADRVQEENATVQDSDEGWQVDESAVRKLRPAKRGSADRPLLGIESEPAIRDDEQVRALVSMVQDAAGEYPAIKKVYLFGDFARGAYTDESAIDLRLELGPFASFGLHDLLVFSGALEEPTGRRVNVISAEVITNQELAAAVERDKVLIYEQ